MNERLHKIVEEARLHPHSKSLLYDETIIGAVIMGVANTGNTYIIASDVLGKSEAFSKRLALGIGIGTGAGFGALFVGFNSLDKAIDAAREGNRIKTFVKFAQSVVETSLFSAISGTGIGYESKGLTGAIIGGTAGAFIGGMCSTANNIYLIRKELREKDTVQS